MSIKTTRVGNTIICYIDNKMYQKTFENDLELINIYEEILNVNDKDPEEIKIIKEKFLPTITTEEKNLEIEFEEAKREAVGNERLIAWMDNIKDDSIFESRNNQLFMKGINIPIPQFLAQEFALEQEGNSELYNALVNFWKLCVLNPNTKCREDLYGFLKKNKMTITPSGCFIAYRNVDLKQEGDLELNQGIAKEWVKLRAQKKDPSQYNLYAKQEVDENKARGHDIKSYYSVSVDKKFTSSIGSDEKMVDIPIPGFADGTTVKVKSYGMLSSDQDPYKGHVYIGNVQELYVNLANLDNDDATIYTDGWSGKMTIRMGEAVSISRNQCDSNPNATCSRGLHAANSDWLKGGYFGAQGLAILINPMNVVACPYADSGKLRCCEYVPVSVIEYDKDQNVIPFEYKVLDLGYYQHTQEQLEKLLNNSTFNYSKKQEILPVDIDFSKYISMVTDLRTTLDEMTTVTKGRIKDI